MSKCNERFINKNISQLKNDIRSCRCKNFSLKQASGLIGGFVPPGSATDLITCSRHYDILAKLVVERRRLSRFPAKMTLVHARALLSTEKISYS